MRRECTRGFTVCKVVKYCGAGRRQKSESLFGLAVLHRVIYWPFHRDWKDHKLVCGWMHIVLSSPKDNRETILINSWR
jgi:hypothetical protein